VNEIPCVFFFIGVVLFFLRQGSEGRRVRNGLLWSGMAVLRSDVIVDSSETYFVPVHAIKAYGGVEV
jgi:uncharacterized membrane protein